MKDCFIDSYHQSKIMAVNLFLFNLLLLLKIMYFVYKYYKLTYKVVVLFSTYYCV